MTNIVSFVVVLVVSMTGSSQAFTCYQCNYTRSPPSNFNGYCGSYPNPYSRSTQRICSAPVCSWTLSNYANPTSKLKVLPFYGYWLLFLLTLYMVGSSGSVVGSVSCVRKVIGSIPTLRRDLGQLLHSQLSVALGCVNSDPVAML